ncbi:MAG: pyridoxal phosphate-dependent aminotransferase [Bryobacteraceae bacterium]|nr:pyridoxal phosphate-dependent aminotransferase [Bryobacteraceae bacterium]
MSIARSVAEQLERASWIRRMFEEGARLKAERGADKVFDFTLGNPDVDPPPEVLATLARLAAEHPPQIHAYMPNPGFPAARQAVARHLAAKTGLPFTQDHILMTVGSAGACNTFLRSVLDPGDEVIVLAPWFSEYPFYIQNHAGRMVVVETDDQFLPDPARIAAAITPRTKAILLNTPNNPTGRVYPAEVLRGIDALLRSLDHPVTVVSDEPYTPIVFDGRTHPEVVTLIERTVIANSWSKTFAIPGERIGYLAISPRLPEAAALFNACAFSNRVLGFVNAPALWQRVVTETIGVQPDISRYQHRRDRMCAALTRLGYEFIQPEGTFYLFPKSPLPDDVAFIRLLLEDGVLAVPGSGFGRPGYFRLSLTVPESVIEGSIPGFARAIERRFPF